MKRTLSLLFIAAMASCSLFAQDDMYFTPKSKAQIEKEKAEIKAEKERKRVEAEKEEARRYAEYLAEKEKEEQEILELKKDWLRKNRHRLSQTEDGQIVYHVGRDVSDDEYNRRGKFKSKVSVISPDSVASDIIDFTAGNGEYPDSLVASIDSIMIDPDFKKNKRHIDYLDDDVEYYYSRRMNRFDYFFGSRRAWMLYNNPWHSHWAYDPFLWNDPWYWYDSWAYSPWFWSDPWYYDSYGYLGWSPFYYHSWGGWGHHHYGGYYNHYNPIFIGGGHHHGGGNHHYNGGGGHSGSGGGHHSISSNINNYDRSHGTRRSGLGSRNSTIDYSNSNRNQAIDSRGNSSYSNSNYSSSSSRGTVTNSGSQYSTSRSSSYSNSSSGSSSSYSSGSRSSGGGGGASHSSGGGGGFRGRR